MGTMSRRDLLGGAGALFATGLLAEDQPKPTGLNFPVVDYHVHLNPNFSLDDALAVSKERGVKFGIAEHAGTKENHYPSILSNDADIQGWIARLEGKPVFKGVQAEWIDWGEMLLNRRLRATRLCPVRCHDLSGPEWRAVEDVGTRFRPR